MRFIRGFPSTMMDDYPLNVHAIIRHAALYFGENEVVSRDVDGNIVRLTYRNVYDRVQRMSYVLENELSIGPGDRVGALGVNTHRYYELYYAVSGIGAVFVEMNFRLSPVEIVHVANHSRVKVLFIDAPLLAQFKGIIPQFGHIEKVVVMGKTNGSFELGELRVYDYEDLIRSGDKYDFPFIDERSACCACYTSGTTGMPKGVYYSHRSFVLHTMAIHQVFSMSPSDSLLQLVPLYHVNGWGMPFAATMVGAKLVFPGIWSTNDPKPIIDLMINEKITRSNGVPSVWISILNYLRTMDPKPHFNMKVVSGGSEPPVAMMRGLSEFGIEVIHAYGSTETSPLTHIYVIKPKVLSKMRNDEYWSHRAKQGLPIFPMEHKVINEYGHDVPWDGKTPGELLERGPWAIREYFNDKRTFDSFYGEGFNIWWKSGNAVVIDEDGYMKIVDRLKDLIKSGGEWVSSVDMENYLMAHPVVYEATVIGVPHPRWGERPLAFVVLKPEYKDKNKDALRKELLDHLSSRFVKWQLPEILFVESIPKTSTGKFDKKVLREQYKDYFGKEKE
ncbi:MAG: long-chain-fatty-acid--CoA ligase [Vulcanisaeta sp.]|uniref:long-chain-fatty-acid--CoA ligase n=1 Tax=Vulcanisaeta sp. TaxID=2020871 RepID=UPI003D109E00